MAIFEYGEYKNTYDPPDNLVDIFENSVSKYPNNRLFGEKDSAGVYQWVTYGQIAVRVNNLRAGLSAIGVKAGDTVGIISHNRKEWFIGEQAAQGLGAIYVPMYENEVLSTCEYIIEDAGIKVLFVSRPDMLEKVKEFPGRISTLKHIYLIEGSDENSMEILEKRGSEKPVSSIKPKPTDVAMLIYTSGTTGEPKGVLISHGGMTENVKAACAWFPNLNERTRSLSIVPWAHSYGIMADLHCSVMIGSSIGIMQSIETLPDDLLKVKPTIILVVPRLFNKVYNAIWTKMRESGGFKLKLFEAALAAAKLKRETGRSGFKYGILDKIVLEKIRARFGGCLENAITAGAVMNKDIAEFFIDVGIPTYDGYGLTEASPDVTLNSPLMGNRLGSVGKPINKTKIIIDRFQTGQENDEGEIICFGPQCMIGYHKKPEKTKDVIVEMNGMRGVRTGDKGRLDDDGFLYITGRFKHEYKLANGKYVYPEAVERDMKLLPWILNAIITGEGREYNVGLIVPDFKLLQDMATELKLSVDPKDPFNPHHPDGLKFKDVLTSRIQNHLKRTIGSYEIPRKFEFIKEDFTVDNGLLTQTMKLKREKVMEKYGSMLKNLYNE